MQIDVYKRQELSFSELFQIIRSIFLSAGFNGLNFFAANLNLYIILSDTLVLNIVLLGRFLDLTFSIGQIDISIVVEQSVICLLYTSRCV